MNIENNLLDTINSGYSPYMTDILGLLSVVSAILVIITKNPIISVLYLILLFILVGCYLIVLGMTFLGLSYLLVYIGAIAILFLFIIMLLDIKSSELLNINKNSNVLGFILTILFFYPIYTLIPGNNNYYNVSSYLFNSITWLISPLSTADTSYSNTINNLNSSSLHTVPLFHENNIQDNSHAEQVIYSVYNQSWETSINSYTHLSIIGNMMYNNYVIWLFLTAFILLLALIGTIILISEKNSQN